MKVKIGHAVYDEHGKARGGVSGDQTGKEVCRWEWYNKPWTAIIRAKNSKVAHKIAAVMEQCCNNNAIGYDQNQRTTLYSLAKALDWNIPMIKTKCETDCSALVAVCVNAAGINVSKDMYTGNELELLRRTNKFDVIDESLSLRRTIYLRRGDILLGKGHTAIVLNDGSRLSRELSFAPGKFMVGEDVTAVQQAVTDKGFPCGMIDGEYGKKTAAAVVRCQHELGLAPDGIVGPKTAEALGLNWIG